MQLALVSETPGPSDAASAESARDGHEISAGVRRKGPQAEPAEPASAIKPLKPQPRAARGARSKQQPSKGGAGKGAAQHDPKQAFLDKLWGRV